MSPAAIPNYPDDPRWAPMLAPVRPDAPCGSDPRGTSAYADIKEAQREDDEGDMGVWQRARKVADWPLVSRLCANELGRTGKDLQLAAWWLLAEVKLRGFAGFTQGLRLVEELIERYWDGLFPPIEDGDTALRAVPLEWIAAKLDVPLRQVPLTKAGHGWYRLQEVQGVPTEAEAADDERKKAKRDEAVADGKLTPEELLEGLRATPASTWEQGIADLENALACLNRLESRSEELCPEEPPTFGRLKDAVRDLTHTLRTLPARKGGSSAAAAPASAPVPKREPAPGSDPFSSFEEDPPPSTGETSGDPFDPFASSEPDDSNADDPFASTSQDEEEPEEEEPVRAAPRRRSTPRPVDREEPAGFDAALSAHAAALREENPASPASYMLIRGARWGELRGAAPWDPRLLEAPPVELRRTLKDLRLRGEWRELLEEAEAAAALPCGRAWLDAHFYTLVACQELGGEFDAVRAAIVTELARLIADFPALPDSYLDDDTPCANAETREFLRALPGISAAASPAPEPLFDKRTANASAADLQQRLRRQTHGRGRFHYRVRLAERLAQDGRDNAALAILRDLLQEIDDRRLIEWEKPEDLALPVRLLCEASTRAGEEPNELTFQLLARLDPMAAAEIG